MMGRLAVLLMVLGLFWVGLEDVEARGGRVNVRGYYRSDGTYVRAHTRSYPRSSGRYSGGGGTSGAESVGGGIIELDENESRFHDGDEPISIFDYTQGIQSAQKRDKKKMTQPAKKYSTPGSTWYRADDGQIIWVQPKDNAPFKGNGVSIDSQALEQMYSTLRSECRSVTKETMPDKPAEKSKDLSYPPKGVPTRYVDINRSSAPHGVIITDAEFECQEKLRKMELDAEEAKKREAYIKAYTKKHGLPPMLPP